MNIKTEMFKKDRAETAKKCSGINRIFWADTNKTVPSKVMVDGMIYKVLNYDDEYIMCFDTLTTELFVFETNMF